MKTQTIFAVLAALAFALCAAIVAQSSPLDPSAAAEGAPAVSSQVTVLGYHRFENPAKDPLAITTEEFRQQMQALKDAGITVISMEDFLAWRRGEKQIPERSALITIDDGYNCAYHIAWPILKEFGYPFTFFVYTNYIDVGGRSITWDQLREMQSQGVEIGSHSVSHDNMVRPKRNKGVDYTEWLREEFRKSKAIIEEHLGVPVRVFAYPYGIQNETVRLEGLDAGYEVLFTVAGKKVNREEPAAAVGRYIIQSGHPQIFRAAISFGTGSVTPGSIAAGAVGSAASVVVSPAHRETIGEDRPEIRAELASLGEIDPKTLEMRVSGLGQVMPEFDPKTGVIRYRPTQRLHHREITVSITTRVKGKKTDIIWQFTIDPDSLVPKVDQLAPPADLATPADSAAHVHPPPQAP